MASQRGNSRIWTIWRFFGCWSWWLRLVFRWVSQGRFKLMQGQSGVVNQFFFQAVQNWVKNLAQRSSRWIIVSFGNDIRNKWLFQEVDIVLWKTVRIYLHSDCTIVWIVKHEWCMTHWIHYFRRDDLHRWWRCRATSWIVGVQGRKFRYLFHYLL